MRAAITLAALLGLGAACATTAWAQDAEAPPVTDAEAGSEDTADDAADDEAIGDEAADDEAADDEPDGEPGEPDTAPGGGEPGGAGGAIPTEPEEEALPLAATPAVTAAESPQETRTLDDAIAPGEPDGGASPDAEPQPLPPAPVEPAGAEEAAEVQAVAMRRDPCATDLRGRPIGPLQTQSGTADGNLGVPHRACPRQEMAIGGDLLLVADTAALYGNIRVNGRGRISAPLMDPRVEGFVDWELFRYQTLISSVTGTYVGLGYLSWGAAGQVVLEEDLVVAITGRMVLPTTTGLDQSSFPLALDLGMTTAFVVDPAVRFHAWVNLVGSVGVGGPAGPRGGARVGIGADLRATEWLSFVLELASGFGYETTLDFLSAQGGVRLGFSDEVGLELALSYPFLGGVRRVLDGALPLSASLMLAWHMR